MIIDPSSAVCIAQDKQTKRECWLDLRAFNNRTEDIGLDEILEQLRIKWGLE